ncbi:hypothetical protein GXB85_15415 [Cellulomonas sp. APG4]|nr:hypothetical protein [Cellulomonas sp. APG4]NCT92329.1 hypothetical protein [Cellulomonas sp. APG4]
MVGLWIAYLVPQRLRFRQQLLDARAEDRFSDGLRVLRVAEVPAPVREVRTARPLLHPAAARGGGGAMDRPHAAGDRIVADAVRRSAAEHARRAAHLAQRRAAARRRALLTVVLLVAAVGGWAVAGLASASLLLGAVPTVLLGGVLVLGRRAVVAGHRADAAWAAGASDRLPLARTAHVIGRAVHPSEATTEVIARVPAAPVRRSAAAAARGEARTEPERSTTAAPSQPEVREQEATEEPTWAPVPVPRPTYALKPAAPRREPAPLTAEHLAPQQVAEQVDADQDAAGTGAVAESTPPAASTAPAPSAGLDLDAVLARRRASGE